MDKFFWAFFHSIMLIVLLTILGVAEIIKFGNDISKKMKSSNYKTCKLNTEKTLVAAIMFGDIFVLITIVKHLVLKNSIVSTRLVVIYLVIYAYIAIKQIIKMTFVPEKREFSLSDIQLFILTYVFWWAIVFLMSSPQSKVCRLYKVLFDYGDTVRVLLFLLYYFLNILFVLGGMYIFLCYLLKVVDKFQLNRRNITGVIGSRFDWWSVARKHSFLNCIKLWRCEKNSTIYKLVKTVPLILFDILKITCIFVVTFLIIMILIVFESIVKHMRRICKLIKEIWYRHENNEWMFMIAQVAGLCSYIIVFFIIQYGGYKDATQNVYEFVGTIILIPYFLNKIVHIRTEEKTK